MILLADNPTADLTTDSGWVVFFKALVIFVFLVLVTLLTIWGERKVVARMQSRPGPTETGPFGLLQSLADGVKLALKEDIIPTAADKAVFIIAPAISVTAAFIAFAVIPFGPTVRIPFTDIHTALQLTDLPVAVLYVLAVASVGVYGIVLGGWSSGSTYPLLGALRSSAQVISYEIAMGLSLVPVFLYAGSMSTSAIVDGQHGTWYMIQLIPSFIIYIIAMVGETNRAPFDLPEAEGELVGGFHTEYSSLKFALFFLAEYVNMVTVSALATTMFLGGWMAPAPFGAKIPGTDFVLWAGANDAYWPVMWFLLKVIFFIFVFIWLRGTLPRLRYDQFMKFGWKVLIPFALVWVVLASVLHGMQTFSDFGFQQRLIVIAAFIATLLAVFWIWEVGQERKAREQEAAEAAIDPNAELDPFAGGYPVPPMPGQRLLRTSGPGSPAPAATPTHTSTATAVEEVPRG